MPKSFGREPGCSAAIVLEVGQGTVNPTLFAGCPFSGGTVDNNQCARSQDEN